jgi:hypothetical protein
MAAVTSAQEALPSKIVVEELKVPVVESRESEETGQSEEVRWITGYVARFPWVGFGAIVLILVLIGMTGLVLATSHGRSKEEWPAYMKWEWKDTYWKEKGQIAPNVMLAVINTLTNICLTIAIGQGVAIAWWRRVMKGSTVEELHRSWGFSTSVLELLKAGKNFNIIALTALMAKVALIDNVLLQQATAIYPDWYKQNGTVVQLPINPRLPQGYTGDISNDGLVISYSSSFRQVLTAVL